MSWLVATLRHSSVSGSRYMIEDPGGGADRLPATGSSPTDAPVSTAIAVRGVGAGLASFASGRPRRAGLSVDGDGSDC